MLSQTHALIALFIFCAVMVLIGALNHRKDVALDDFIRMNGKLGTLPGALSIAVSWMWAPAVFICSLKAFTEGLPGIFWFTAPNILCFFIFAVLVYKLRQQFKEGYSLPDFLAHKFPNDLYVHKASLIIFFGYQLGAVIINCIAGGALLSLLTGLNQSIAIIGLSSAAFLYSFIGGLRASVATDKVQIALILGLSFILVPWVTYEAGGIDTLLSGLGGQSGDYNNLFNPAIAYSFGIAVTISLISGPFADQMFYQRAFAAPLVSLRKIFIIGGLIFGLVPIALSLLGFIGAAPSVLSQINVTDPQMIGPIVIDHFLPKWALVAFVVLAFSGLCSTLDSAYTAIGSLGSVDIHKRYINKQGSHVKAARISMSVFYIIGTAIALLNLKLLWVFLIYGALASAILIPIAFSILSKNITPKAIFTSIIAAVVIVLPLSTYANIHDDTDLIVLSAITSPIIGLIICGGSLILKGKR